MTYVVLARKYRPRTFDEVIGQDVVTRVLRGALDEARVGHAYLFCGPRGTGKTTIARILAKCLNCEVGPTSTPCGKCERCEAADAGRDADIIELDAASHTGVDKIRELRDEVAYAPMRARTKVYIIDEVHMLSKGAFNALLKTLEEPPPHVIFLFATTEPHKVPDTILSRCQVLRLNPLSEAEIEGRLHHVFEREEVRYEEGVLRELARSARGGMRDALSLADRLLALAGGEPTLEDLARLRSDAGTREADALLDAVEVGDKAEVLRTLAGFEGGEGELAASLLERLRTSVVLAHCGKDTPLVTGSVEERQLASERAGRLGAERIELLMQELLRARERMRRLPGQERLILEVTLLDLAREETTLPIAAIEQRLGELARAIAAGEGTVAPRPVAARPAPRQSAAPKPPEAPRETRTPEPAPVRDPSEPNASPPTPSASSPGPDAASPGEQWDAMLERLRSSHGTLVEVLERYGRVRDENGGGLIVRFTGLDRAERKLVEDRRHRAACAGMLERLAGHPLEVHWELPAEEPSAPSVPAPTAGKSKRTPASSSDGLTKEVADLFGGAIEDLP